MLKQYSLFTTIPSDEKLLNTKPQSLSDYRDLQLIHETFFETFVPFVNYLFRYIRLAGSLVQRFHHERVVYFIVYTKLLLSLASTMSKSCLIYQNTTYIISYLIQTMHSTEPKVQENITKFCTTITQNQFLIGHWLGGKLKNCTNLLSTLSYLNRINLFITICFLTIYCEILKNVKLIWKQCSQKN